MTVQAETNGRPTTEEFVQYEVTDGVATIWLNRPEVKNCVNWGLLTQLGAALERAEDGRRRARGADPRTRPDLLRGRGPQHARLRVPGHDEQLREDRAGLGAHVRPGASTWASRPIAVVEGHAVAGGFELMISCDFAIAADDAKIGDFHIRRALFGGAGPIYRLPRYIGLRKTKELLFTGKLLSGKECEEWGLANVSAPTDQLEQAIADFVAPMKDKSAFTMRITKLAANRGLDGDTETLIALESMTCNVAHQSDDAREGVQAFLEKREPVWKHR
jgi:enoyl-CoA hydratase/carnithine racemase